MGRGVWGVVWKTWRRPTLPRLETQYHGRWGFSRPSSGWDRVVSPRHGHQVVRATPTDRRGRDGFWCAGWSVCVWRVGRRATRVPVVAGCPGVAAAHDGLGWDRAGRAIRIGWLSALPHVHLRPIDVMVYHGPRGDLVSRWVSRLDAFSGYPVRTWLPGGAAGATTGPPEVRPSRSSRTRDRSSQVSFTHGR